MKVKTIYSKELKRNIIICSVCGLGITGTAYSSSKKGIAYICEPCVDKEIAR